MERRQPRRHRRQRGAAAAAAPALPAPAAQAQVVAVLQPPFRVPGPIIDPRSPRADEIFAATFGGGNPNYLADNERIGRRFMPIPPTAPAIEATFFEYQKAYRTGEELTDLLMRLLYDEHLNAVGDKRREVLQHQWRSSSNKALSKRLEADLKALSAKLIARINELAEATNWVVPYPEYFKTYPALG